MSRDSEPDNVYVLREPTLMIEEFGPTLYRVIALFAEREQLRKWQALDVHRERRDRLAWYKSQEKDLTDAIVSLMPEIDPKDQAKLLDRFEPRKAG